jgi:hypothetical protein
MISRVLLLLLFAASAHAAESGDYAGRFEMADAADGQARIDAGVEEACLQFPAMFRGIARKKLSAASPLPLWFEFGPGDDSMTIRTNLNEEGWTSDLSATVVQVQGDNGSVDLKRWMDGGALRAEGRTGKGVSRFVFALSDDGKTLTITTTTSSDRLDKPLTYDLVYQRK